MIFASFTIAANAFAQNYTRNIASGLNLNSIYSADPGHCYIVSDSASLFTSSDAGFNWTRTTGVAGFSPTSVNLKTVFFSDTNYGWIGGTSGNAARTTNGGQSWQTMAMADPTETIHQFRFSDSLHGYAVGNDNKVQSTTNGGATWSVATTFSGVDSLNSVFVFPSDTSTVWVAGTNGFVSKSTDDGATWLTLSTGITAQILQMKWATHGIGWIVGKNSTILCTITGGNNWNVIGSPFTGDISSVIAFTDGSEVIVGGATGQLYYSGDFGRSWNTFGPALPAQINNISPINNTAIFIYTAGNSGNVGVTFTAQGHSECFDAYTECLNKCSMNNNDCIKICSDMYIKCRGSAATVAPSSGVSVAY